MQRNDDLNQNNVFDFNINIANDEYNDEYESDGSDDMDERYFYDPDEPSRTRYNIIMCEIYNRNIHGIPETGSLVDTHYLVTGKFKNIDLDIINDICDYLNSEYIHIIPSKKRHPIIRNYRNIIEKPYYIRPEIGECIYLPTNECIAILKTFWIRIIQRNWRRVLKERIQIIKERSSYQFILKREILTPKNVYWPSLRGLLYNLTSTRFS